MSLRKSWSVSVETSPAACLGATSGSSSSTRVDDLDLQLLER